MTLGMENGKGVTVGVVDVQVTDGDSAFILGGLLFGNVKWTGESPLILSESKLSSFLAELSSVLDAEEIPESGDVGLSWGNVLSVRMYFGGRAKIKQNQLSQNNLTVNFICSCDYTQGL